MLGSISRRVLLLFLVLCIGFFLVIGCDSPGPKTYTLTVQVEGQGSVDPDVGDHEYEEDAVVELTATPSEGWEFKEWVGEVAHAGSASTTIFMNKEQTVTAVFEEIEYIVIDFEDENLEQAIRKAIDKLEGDLYSIDVIGLEELEARGKGIESLEGIQHLQNLKRLYLEHDRHDSWDQDDWTYNYIEDLTPLQNLTSLESLWFGDNQVSDISPLQNLTSLAGLWFWSNQVSDINPLQNLTSLAGLNFGGNQVSDISVLQNLASLEILSFWGNQVSDISPLQNLTSLESLWFGDNQVSDINPLVANDGFGSGDSIDMRNNYLDLTEGSQNIQDINTLIGRGVDVQYEPQREHLEEKDPI